MYDSALMSDWRCWVSFLVDVELGREVGDADPRLRAEGLSGGVRRHRGVVCIRSRIEPEVSIRRQTLCISAAGLMATTGRALPSSRKRRSVCASPEIRSPCELRARTSMWTCGQFETSTWACAAGTPAANSRATLAGRAGLCYCDGA